MNPFNDLGIKMFSIHFSFPNSNDLLRLNILGFMQYFIIITF